MNESRPKLFGESIRMIRHQRGKTLEDMSAASGISVSHWSRIERGERSPSARVVDAMSDALGVHKSAILLAPNAVEKVLAALATPDIRKVMSRLDLAFDDVQEQVKRLGSSGAES